MSTTAVPLRPVSKSGVATLWVGIIALVAAAIAWAVFVSGPPAIKLETVTAGDLVLSVQAGGELKSSKATPLMVPGQNWSSRRLTWMVPEGSLVKKGELIARFGTELHVCGMDEAALARAVDAVRDAPGFKAERMEAGLEEVFIHLMSQSADNMK